MALAHDNQQPFPNTVVQHVLTETSSKLLAGTLLEMGAMLSEHERIITQLKQELNWTSQESAERLRSLDKTKEHLTRTQDVFGKKVAEFDDKATAFQERLNFILKKNSDLKLELIARDSIIDSLLTKYNITPSDKKKIKMLRSTQPDACVAAMDQVKRKQ
jgi:hypothetical protein